jgi:hypothetical protein
MKNEAAIVMCFVMLFTGWMAGLITTNVYSTPHSAPGTAATGTATIELPSGAYTWSGPATFKYDSDGRLLWCRVEPWYQWRETDR